MTPEQFEKLKPYLHRCEEGSADEFYEVKKGYEIHARTDRITYINVTDDLVFYTDEEGAGEEMYPLSLANFYEFEVTEVIRKKIALS